MQNVINELHNNRHKRVPQVFRSLFPGTSIYVDPCEGVPAMRRKCPGKNVSSATGWYSARRLLWVVEVFLRYRTYSQRDACGSAVYKRAVVAFSSSPAPYAHFLP